MGIASGLIRKHLSRAGWRVSSRCSASSPPTGLTVLPQAHGRIETTDIQPPEFAGLAWRQMKDGIFIAPTTKTFFAYYILDTWKPFHNAGFSSIWSNLFGYGCRCVTFDPAHAGAVDAAELVERLTIERADQIKQSKKRKRTWA